MSGQTTIREFVESMGADRVDLGMWGGQALLDHPCDVRFATSGSDADRGRLFVSCGGQAVISFHGERYGRSTTLAYLVVDGERSSAVLRLAVPA